jgi:hypothetical protein
LSTAEDSTTDIDYISEFLDEVTRRYLEDQKKNRVRSRYERNGLYCHRVQTLSSSRGLETIALDKKQEELLRHEINTYVNDKDFYRRIGMPY